MAGQAQGTSLTALEGTELGRYLVASRQPAYSLLFFLPLIVTYEALAVLANLEHPMEVRNGADVLLREILGWLHIQLPQALLVAMVVVLAALASHLRGRSPLVAQYFPVMLLESIVWAFVMAVLLRRALGVLASPSELPGGFLTRMMLFLGAGVYEEIVFRVLMVWAILGVAQKTLRMRPPSAVILAVGGSALLFSAFHHVGPFGEPFSAPVFVYRALAGLFLSALYVARGLGIAAWSHALYDIFTYLQIT